MAGKPYELSGEATPDVVENINRMLGELYDITATSQHALLSSTHNDVVASDVARGAVIVGDSTPAWAGITPTIAATFLRYDGADSSWAAIVETDITDGILLARVASAETISAAWKFTVTPAVSAGVGWSTRNAGDTASWPLIRFASGSVVIGSSGSDHNFISFATAGATKMEIFSSGSTGTFSTSGDNTFVMGDSTHRWGDMHIMDLHTYQSFRWAGLISPTALGAGNNNNYNPTSLADAVLMRLTGNATTSVLTGIVITGTAADDNGRVLILKNIGTPSINVTNEDANSTAANRILTATGRTRVLETGATMSLLYDATGARWVEHAGHTNADDVLTAVKTADESVNNSATLQDDDHLFVTVVAGATYEFSLALFGTQVSAVPGLKLAMAGTATATSIKYEVIVHDDTSGLFAAYARSAALGTSVNAATLGANDFYAEIHGTIVVNAAGTLRLQFAQNTASANNTTLQQHSSMLVKRIVP